MKKFLSIESLKARRKEAATITIVTLASFGGAGFGVPSFSLKTLMMLLDIRSGKLEERQAIEYMVNFCADNILDDQGTPLFDKEQLAEVMDVTIMKELAEAIVKSQEKETAAKN